ncbi:MAG: pyridoxamine 5'-phosphate oxidase [Dysgonamonadaceae bacterium]|nr:pyridoxamine 5'-phosphate oxidase [Dysgonamonadaceae bacterium]MDD3356274.1 pyridoxamine 5'-phosphate oxidase [Dysgonamonadaceae bacterium]MDD3727626.1 pyridoxamine 5'-phosphate oxidase [Dysgonamonadaceae bacterium]MDD4246551.1 pyridoxamine 5'-phosphate oxidase [Dysgonamonadaceae bacterium]MDD4605715.1 pyridoxamine 5'-phosphate oxidase [Dysgonamonadaceae bacterium]
MTELYNFRKDYKLDSLSKEEVDANPISQFEKWMNQAISFKIIEPNAMTLATATPDGKPSARVVLLKSYNEKGFVFYTNYESRKGEELNKNPYACIVFDWHLMERQVRIEGVAKKISPEQSDKYFNSRPESSQMGAWISPQSTFIDGREELENRKLKIEAMFQDKLITRPPHWGGYVLIPHTIEFWQGRQSRLHDRLIYIKTEDEWILRRLAP